MLVHAVVKKGKIPSKRKIEFSVKRSKKEERNIHTTLSIATSQKKASTKVNSLNIRKAVNSIITTLPDNIQETLNVKLGDEIQYIKTGGVKNAALIVKKEPTTEISSDTIDYMLDNYFDKYDSGLKDLIEM